MSDDTLVRFTAHELRRDDLRALMVRSNGPAMARALWHFGVLVVTGTLVWMGRATLWVIPLLIAHGYVLAFLFCAFHESAHRTAFRSRWLKRARGLGGGLPHLLAVSQLSRVPLGASPLHAGRRARSRALLSQAPLSARLSFRAHGHPELPAPSRGHPPPRRGTGRPSVDGARRAPPSDPRGADLSRALRCARPALRARALARAAPRVDSAVARGPGFPPAVSARGAHRLCFHRRVSRQHADDPHGGSGPAVRVEHAVSRRAPRLSRRTLSRPAAATRAGAGPDRQSRSRLSRGHGQGEPLPLRRLGPSAGCWAQIEGPDVETR